MLRYSAKRGGAVCVCAVHHGSECDCMARSETVLARNIGNCATKEKPDREGEHNLSKNKEETVNTFSLHYA